MDANQIRFDRDLGPRRRTGSVCISSQDGCQWDRKRWR